ncbi:mevalonate kinase isoform X2 [Parasteatoda tepidariorum]|nr:mevalonate kinase isoform X2 [Parasteatoda tepidariorum]
MSGDIISANDELIEQIMKIFNISSPEYSSDIEKNAIVAFLYLWIYVSKSYNVRSFFSCHVIVDSELSIGAGMGSSASYSVCLSTAMLMLCGRITPRLLPEDKEIINKWAFETERIFHGKPSGIDNSICTYGGALLFKNGVVSDILTNIPNINILLVDTKVPRNTKVMVVNVKEKLDTYPVVIESIMAAIEGITNESWKFFKDFNQSTTNTTNVKSLQELVDINQHLLSALGVSHTKIDKISEVAKKYDCSCKLTGAGGGGCAFIVLPSKTEKSEFLIKDLIEELERNGFGVWNLFLGTPGVQAEFQNS